jgi:hypothetical protein
MKIRTRYLAGGMVAVALLTTAGSCGPSAAEQANQNLSTAADNFEVERRIVGINGITDEVLFEVTGYCSLDGNAERLDVLCKVSDEEVERTTLGLSDNVTFVVTQLQGKKVDFYRPRIIFRPTTLVPDAELALTKDDVGGPTGPQPN